MTDREIIHKFLDKNYKIVSNDSQLCCYCVETQNRYDFISLITELKSKIFGDFASLEIIEEWINKELKKKRILINEELTKIDLTKGSFLASNDFVGRLVSEDLRKEYLERVFKFYYIEFGLENKHKELFKEFSLKLDKNNWAVYWNDKLIQKKDIKELFKKETVGVISQIMLDFEEWRLKAIDEEFERKINNL